MKGIDANHKVFIHRCSCHTHYLNIDYYLDDKCGYIGMTIDTSTLWQRVKHILKYLYKGGRKMEYWSEIFDVATMIRSASLGSFQETHELIRG